MTTTEATPKRKRGRPKGSGKKRANTVPSGPEGPDPITGGNGPETALVACKAGAAPVSTRPGPSSADATVRRGSKLGQIAPPGRVRRVGSMGPRVEFTPADTGYGAGVESLKRTLNIAGEIATPALCHEAARIIRELRSELARRPLPDDDEAATASSRVRRRTR